MVIDENFNMFVDSYVADQAIDFKTTYIIHRKIVETMKAFPP